MSINNDNIVLLSIFHCGKKKLRIIFHKGLIVWDNEKPPSGKYHIHILFCNC